MSQIRMKLFINGRSQAHCACRRPIAFDTKEVFIRQDPGKPAM